MADGSLTDADFEQAGLRLDRRRRRGHDHAGPARTTQRADLQHLAHAGPDRRRRFPRDVRVVVVRGEGPAFSAGIDLRLFSREGVPGEDALRPARRGVHPRACRRATSGCAAPTSSPSRRCRATRSAAGFQLALACDLRVVADDVKFAMKEPALGIVPDLTGTKPLVDIVGVPRALELCLTTRTVYAEEAARLGLAELVVPARRARQGGRRPGRGHPGRPARARRRRPSGCCARPPATPWRSRPRPSAASSSPSSARFSATAPDPGPLAGRNPRLPLRCGPRPFPAFAGTPRHR